MQFVAETSCCMHEQQLCSWLQWPTTIIYTEKLAFISPSSSPFWKKIIPLTFYSRNIKGMLIAGYSLSFCSNFSSLSRKEMQQITSGWRPSYQQHSRPTLRGTSPSSCFTLHDSLTVVTALLHACQTCRQHPLASSEPPHHEALQAHPQLLLNSPSVFSWFSLISQQPGHFTATTNTTTPTTSPSATPKTASPFCFLGM